MMNYREVMLYEEVLSVAGNNRWVLVLYNSGGYKVEYKDHIGYLGLKYDDIIIDIDGSNGIKDYIKIKGTDVLGKYNKLGVKGKKEVLGGVSKWLMSNVLKSKGWI